MTTMIYHPPSAGPNVAKITGEPTGFENRTDSTISFNESTRTFSIAPTGSNYNTYVAGKKKVHTGTSSIVIPNTTAAAFIYFDKTTGAISQMATFDNSLIVGHVWIAVVYWNATQGKAILVADERHGLVMDSATHLDLHQSFGTTWVSGLGLTNITPDQSGGSNADAQCGVADGQINDEDIAHSIVDGSPQDISPLLKAPIIWRIGTDWYIAAVADYPLMYSGRTGTSYTGANGRLGYNLNSGGSWSLAQVANGHIVLAHILATNDIRYPVMAVCGTADYATIANARAAAYDELLSLTNLPFTEFKPLGTLILETSTTTANAVKARIRSTDEGGAYVDLRRNLSLGSSGAAATSVQREVFVSSEPSITYPAVNFNADATVASVYVPGVGWVAAPTGGSGSSTPTTMQADLTVTAHTQLLFRVPIAASAGQLIILEEDAQLVGV